MCMYKRRWLDSLRDDIRKNGLSVSGGGSV